MVYDTHLHKSQEMNAKAPEERGFRGISMAGEILCSISCVRKSTIKPKYRCSRMFPTYDTPTEITLSSCILVVTWGTHLKLRKYSEWLVLPYAPRERSVVAIYHGRPCSAHSIRQF